MKKIRVYRIDNNDTDQIIDNIETVIELIKVELESAEVQDDGSFAVQVCVEEMDEEEFKNLPDAY